VADRPAFLIRFPSVPVNGHVGKADVAVIDRATERTQDTARINPQDLEGRLKLGRRRAAKPGRTPEQHDRHTVIDNPAMPAVRCQAAAPATMPSPVGGHRPRDFVVRHLPAATMRPRGHDGPDDLDGSNGTSCLLAPERGKPLTGVRLRALHD
jgi:hypothetical protein